MGRGRDLTNFHQISLTQGAMNRSRTARKCLSPAEAPSLQQTLVSTFARAVPRRIGQAPGLFAAMGATVGFTSGAPASGPSPVQTNGSALIAGETP